MKLPPLPLPAIMEQSPGGRRLFAYSESQIAVYGLACAEAMREECAKKVDDLHNSGCKPLGMDIRAIEVER